MKVTTKAELLAAIAEAPIGSTIEVEGTIDFREPYAVYMTDDAAGIDFHDNVVLLTPERPSLLIRFWRWMTGS